MISKFSRSSSRCSSPVSRHRWLQTPTSSAQALQVLACLLVVQRPSFSLRTAANGLLTVQRCPVCVQVSYCTLSAAPHSCITTTWEPLGAHSSVYDCRSPSGYTPPGKSSATGTDGGLVCSVAFFLPAGIPAQSKAAFCRCDRSKPTYKAALPPCPCQR